jgi:pyruvate/2-oxoglutarate dehydrogenase complex dihydrolipoamide acyltransferase (E2) component
VVALVAVPDLGREMVGGLVAEWYRPDGAEVAPGEAVCRLECDFIAFEIEAEMGGILRHRRPAGSIERKGTILGVVVGRGEPLPGEDELRAAEGTQAVVKEPELPAWRDDARAPAGAAPADDGGAAGWVGAYEVAPAGGAELAEESEPPVVVPFPRRTYGERGAGNDRAERLPEPGGAIPGLPLWDEEQPGDRTVEGIAVAEPTLPVAPAVAFERSGVPAHGEVLSAHVGVSWVRAREAVEALADEWHPFGPRPLVEDLAVRAIARALAEAGIDPGPAGLVVVEPEADRSTAIEEPLEDEFRRMVQGRADGRGSFELAQWVVVSAMPLGVERIEPRLAGGRVAFGLGSGPEGEGTVTMRYDSTTFGEGDAGRVLARVRSLVENPFRLWG